MNFKKKESKKNANESCCSHILLSQFFLFFLSSFWTICWWFTSFQLFIWSVWCRGECLCYLFSLKKILFICSFFLYCSWFSKYNLCHRPLFKNPWIDLSISKHIIESYLSKEEPPKYPNNPKQIICAAFSNRFHFRFNCFTTKIGIIWLSRVRVKKFFLLLPCCSARHRAKVKKKKKKFFFCWRCPIQAQAFCGFRLYMCIHLHCHMQHTLRTDTHTRSVCSARVCVRVRACVSECV